LTSIARWASFSAVSVVAIAHKGLPADISLVADSRQEIKNSRMTNGEGRDRSLCHASFNIREFVI
jgi:hypothetical protein